MLSSILSYTIVLNNAWIDRESGECVTLSPLISTANAQQQEAITTTEGPLLIIAGPGSGKTFTLVARIVYLLNEKQVTPEQIMVVTFTDKAAQELTTRISNRLDALNLRFNLNEMYLGTFHSICLRWLQDHREFTRLKHNFTMMDEFDQRYFFYQHFQEYEKLEGIAHIAGPATTSTWDRSENLMKRVNLVAEEALEVETLLTAPDEKIRALGRCVQRYHKQLEENNALDFSTIQYEALRLLRTFPEVRDTIKAQIAYVMVDEYQDTNTIQERILLELVGTDNPNLCVVGDDDQGIYRFRGATIRNILQFGSGFAGQIAQVSLTTNYRSHREIIHFCDQWMAGQEWMYNGQTFRYRKQIAPRQAEFPAMPAVVRVSAQGSEEAWQQEVFDFLQALRTEGQLTDWNQAAFLFRSVKNPKVRNLAAFLEQQGIPVYSPRANQFFDREEIRLMIGALISVFRQFPQARMWNDTAKLAIWDYYDNECFAPFIAEVCKPENADLLDWMRKKANRHYPLRENTDYAFSGLFYELLQFPMFSRYLGEDLLKQGLQQSRPMRNLGLFSQLLNKFEYLHHVTVFSQEYLDLNLRHLFNRFLRFLKEGGINEYEDEAEYAPSGYVSFLTIHQAKGLEFPVVLVDSLDAVPRKQYNDLDEKLAGYLSRPPFEPLAQMKNYDFRRLYYTAFSRAQNLLVLTALEKQGQGRTPSKYFQEYYQKLPTWRDPALHLADLPLEQVKRANLKREYSFTSHITVYENCAEQYRFFRELDFTPVRRNAILFGTLVHQTIEDIHRTVLRKEEHRLSEDQVRAWFDTNYAQLTKRERVYLTQYARNLAVEQVLRYYRRRDGDWSQIREAEVDVSLVKDRYILTGKVDLITGQDGTVELVDFKSERKLDVNDPKDREKRNQYQRQLEIYAHIVEQRTGQKISKTHLYYTSEEDGNPYVTFHRDRQSTEQTIQTFDSVVDRIEAKDFAIQARPPKLCKECDMRDYCNTKNWKFRGNRS